MGPTARQKATVAAWAPSTRRQLTGSQLKQGDFRPYKNPQRNAHYSNPATHVELAGPLREVPHHVLRDQAAGGPADDGQVELTAVDVAGERERYRARGGAVEGAGAMRQENPERVLRWRRETERRLEVVVLRIVGAPVARVIDAHEGERRSTALDHVRAVPDEYLSRVTHAFDDGVLAGVAVMVAEHRHHAEWRVQVAKGADIVGDERLGDVDHVTRLHDEIGAKCVGLRDDRAHFFFGHVDAGVDVREMRDADAVQTGRQVGEQQCASRDQGQPLRAPDAVGGHAEAGGGVGVGRAGEELATGQGGRAVRRFGGWRAAQFANRPTA